MITFHASTIIFNMQHILQLTNFELQFSELCYRNKNNTGCPGIL